MCHPDAEKDGPLRKREATKILRESGDIIVSCVKSSKVQRVII